MISELKLRKSSTFTHNLPHFVTTIDVMTTAQQMTVREIRKLGTGMPGEWIAAQDAAGTYTVRCGDVELCTVNGRKPRKFRSLDVLREALREEIGVTEFRVMAVEE
jgi:hypothetical protein